MANDVLRHGAVAAHASEEDAEQQVEHDREEQRRHRERRRAQRLDEFEAHLAEVGGPQAPGWTCWRRCSCGLLVVIGELGERLGEAGAFHLDVGKLRILAEQAHEQRFGVARADLQAVAFHLDLRDFGPGAYGVGA